MSNSPQSAPPDIVESMLFDDGFAIVDDINAPIESMKEKEGNPPISNGKDVMDPINETKKDEVEASKLKNNASVTSTNVREKPNETKCVASKTPSTTPLVISNDVALGSDADKSVKQAKKVPELQDENSRKTPFRKKPEASFVWVSNISKLIKASTLKKHFSECGKVNTAKVVTNGKVFFGYVEFESGEHAATCVKSMNNSVLGGKKVLVSRCRPDITRKTISANAKKIDKIENTPVISSESELPKKKADENSNVDENKKNEKEPVEDQKSANKNKDKDDAEKRKKDQKSEKSEKNSRSDDDLRKKLNESMKRISRMKVDLDRAHIETNNLRRRLSNEQKKTKAEEMRVEKYKSEIRALSDQLKQVRNGFERDIQRLTKKHKLELEKLDHQRDNYIRKEEELKRRQEELEREFRKLEDAKKSMERTKRSRKSRSLSPPSKRYRGRGDSYSDRKITPPPPKLTYDDKKKGIYNRLGDYGEKVYGKETNGRHHRGDVDTSKNHWASSWNKPNISTATSKNYAERFGTTQSGYPVSSAQFYSGSEYFKHGHLENSRKY